jgi:aspartate/methionine/tyrosine aminotransferase
VPVPFTVVRWAVQSGVAQWLPTVRKRLGPLALSLHYLSDRVLATPLHHWDDGRRAAAGRAIDLSTLPAWTVSSRPSPAMRHDLDCPPLGLPLLRERLAAAVADDTGVTFDPADEIVITPGGRGAIHAIAETFLNRRDRVLLFDPGAPLFVDAVRHRRAIVRWTATTLSDDGLTVDEERLRRALAGAKLVLLGQPAGPTGCYWSPTTLEHLAHWAQRYDVLVVWDRSLTRWSCAPLPSEFPWLTALRRRVLVVHRIAAGVGAILGPAGLVQPCGLTAHRMMPPPPVALQQLAVAHVGDRDDAAVRADRAALRDDVGQRLAALGLRSVVPRCGPFVWVDVSATKLTGRAFCDRLAQAGVIAWPGDRCGPSGRHCVRLTWAGDEGRCRAGLRRIEEFVSRLANDGSSS